LREGGVKVEFLFGFGWVVISSLSLSLSLLCSNESVHDSFPSFRRSTLISASRYRRSEATKSCKKREEIEEGGFCDALSTFPSRQEEPEQEAHERYLTRAQTIW